MGNAVHLWGIWRGVDLWWSCDQWSLRWNSWDRTRKPFGSCGWEQNDNANKTPKKIKKIKTRIHLRNMEDVPIACLTDIVVKTKPTTHEKVRFNRARASLLLPSSLSFVSERLSNWGAYETCSRFPRKTNSSSFFYANLSNINIGSVQPLSRKCGTQFNV